MSSLPLHKCQAPFDDFLVTVLILTLAQACFVISQTNYHPSQRFWCKEALMLFVVEIIAETVVRRHALSVMFNTICYACVRHNSICSLVIASTLVLHLKAAESFLETSQCT